MCCDCDVSLWVGVRIRVWYCLSLGFNCWRMVMEKVFVFLVLDWVWVIMLDFGKR